MGDLIGVVVLTILCTYAWAVFDQLDEWMQRDNQKQLPLDVF